MTLFEYLAIAFSLVFSFAAMRLVAGLPYAVQPDRRYWIHLALVSVSLVAAVNVFWILWAYREATWTLPRFWLVLSIPGSMYYCACTLVPEHASAVADWRAHYYSVRQRYFVGFTVWCALTFSAATVILDMPWLHRGRFGQVGMLSLALLGSVSASERIHSMIAIVLLLLTVVMALTVFTEPVSLAS